LKTFIILILLFSIFSIWNISAFKIGEKKVNFSQSIIYQKKSVKIYGKTIPNLKILINVWNEKYKIKSSSKWIYSLKIHTLDLGKYKVVSKIFLKNKYYLVPRKKEIVITSIYVNKMRGYYVKKKILFNPEIRVPVPKVTPILSKLSKPKTVVNFLLLYILLWIMSLLMMFLVLRKNNLI